MKYSNVELLAPAGCFPSLRTAIANGVDAVFFGLARLNLRTRTRRSSQREDLAEICRICQVVCVHTCRTRNTLSPWRIS